MMKDVSLEEADPVDAEPELLECSLDSSSEIPPCAQEQLLRDEAAALFAKADVDSNGSLSHSELKKEIQKDSELRERLSATKWKTFFIEIDSDRDGLITQEEFVAYYIKHCSEGVVPDGETAAEEEAAAAKSAEEEATAAKAAEEEAAAATAAEEEAAAATSAEEEAAAAEALSTPEAVTQPRALSSPLEDELSNLENEVTPNPAQSALSQPYQHRQQYQQCQQYQQYQQTLRPPLSVLCRSEI